MKNFPMRATSVVRGSVFRALAVCLLIPSAAVTQTRVSGIIDRDVRWTADKSPYLVTDDILVTRTGRLIISPGTRIVIGRPQYYDKSIRQLDYTDSITVAIKVQGVLSAQGRRDRRIVFSPLFDTIGQCSWYGIVFDGADRSSELAFADIAGACNGILAMSSSPLIRNSVFEYNTVGIRCAEDGNVRVYNCVVARNSASGIMIRKANPVFYNNIICNNRNLGVWCDGISAITFMYNCVFANHDGNLLDCDPELGIMKRVNARKDSTDFAFNIFTDPVFAGSRADSLATERDITIPTDRSRIADTTVAKALHDTLPQSPATRATPGTYARYSLSTYSPCIRAGNPRKEFRNGNGTANDMGIYGGPEFFAE